MHPNMPASPTHEFARSIAFANLRFPERFHVPELSRQDRHSAVAGAAAYTPFVNELARVLRYPGLRLPKERYPSELSLFAVFRPLYGFDSRKDVLASQATIRTILADLLSADVTLLLHEVHNVALSLHAITLTIPRAQIRRTSGRRGRPYRGLLQTVQMSLAYVPQPGHETFVYGTGLGVSANLVNRLSKCERCDRFILGRTDRQVRFCAEAECRMPRHTVVRDAPTKAAEYQRKHRSRVAKWEQFERRYLRPAVSDVNSASDVRERIRAAEVLTVAVRDGREMVNRCFPRASSKARQAAIAGLTAALALIPANGTHKRTRTVRS